MPASGLKMIRQPPLAEQVFQSLRGMILSQAFQPGERIVEEDVARQHAVSRTPVREALFRLHAAGLIEQVNGQFVIPTLSLKDVREIFEIRRMLEPGAAAAILPGLGGEDLQTFVRARDRTIGAESVSAAVAANVAFRALWVDRIENRRLREVLGRFDDQVSFVRRATLVDPEARGIALAGVCRLTDAFLQRDAGAVRRVMEDFIDAAQAAFERAVGTMKQAERRPEKQGDQT